MALTEHQKKHLRRLGHALHPVVLIGQRGLTESVAAEMRRALDDHELVKIRARVDSRDSRDAIFAELSRLTASEFVYRIGNVGLFFKQNNRIQKILLPDP
ncbi:MAG TPA: YhbY family RNA-binding protein [Steroidobacteraceae bacterium]